jgi:hypothetical protein
VVFFDSVAASTTNGTRSPDESEQGLWEKGRLHAHRAHDAAQSGEALVASIGAKPA